MRFSISQLWQGLSLQANWKKLPGQVDVAQNLTNDVLDGAWKRGATELVADIDPELLSPDSDFYTTSLREFRVFIGDGSVVVIDQNGNPVPVVDETATDFAYIADAVAARIQTTSSIDTIVVLNRDIVPVAETTPDYSVVGTVNTYEDLFIKPGLPDVFDPTQEPVNTHAKVLARINLDPSGYYKKTYKDPNNIYENDVWIRVAAPADPDGRIDTSTWPHRLVYLPESNTFSWDVIPFTDRLSGNEVTNRVFPVEGVGIECVSFFSSRLFFIGRDTINSTKASNIFEIFVNDMDNITDDDPIQKDIIQSNVGLPLFAEILGNALFLICENGQLTFDSGDQALTNINGRIRQITNFKSLRCRPYSSGNRLAMADSLKNIQIYQWVDADFTVANIGSITEHVVGLFDTENLDSIFINGDTTYILTRGQTVWVHDLYQIDGRTGQSAWSQHIYAEPVKFIDAWEDRVRHVQLGDTYSILKYLHRKPINPVGWAFDPRLDRREMLRGTYLSDLDQTQFEFANREADEETHWVVTTKRPNGEESKEFFRPVWTHENKFRIDGKWDIYSHYVGVGYISILELAKLFAGTSNQRVMMSRLIVFGVDVTDYLVEVGRDRGKKRLIEVSGRNLGAGTYNESQVRTDVQGVFIICDAKTTRIRLIQDTPGTATWSALEYILKLKGKN